MGIYNWTVRLTDGNNLITSTNNALDINISNISTTDTLNINIAGVSTAEVLNVDATNLNTNVDNGFITPSQTNQVVISETHGYELDANLWKRITSYTKGDSQALETYLVGGSLNFSYADDAAFDVGTDYGAAAGGVYTGDTVDAGDYGVFRITANREQAVVIGNAGTDADVLTTQMSTAHDEAKDALAVTAACYGYAKDAAVNSKMRPLVIMADDGQVDASLMPQVVINENHIWDNSVGVWKRWHSDGSNAAKVNVTNTVATTVSGTVEVDVNEMPDSTLSSEYIDDANFFIGGSGLAVGGIATSDSINADDFGVFRMNTDREQYVYPQTGTRPSTHDPDTANVGRMKKYTQEMTVFNGLNQAIVATDETFRGKVLKFAISVPFGDIGLNPSVYIDASDVTTGDVDELLLNNYSPTAAGMFYLYVRHPTVTSGGSTATTDDYAPGYMCDDNLNFIITYAGGNVTANRTWRIHIYYEE